MNKKKIITFLVIGLSCLLASCSNNKGNLSESVEIPESSRSAIEGITDTDAASVNESEDNKRVDPIVEERVPDVYIPVLDGIYNLITDFDEESDTDNPYCLIGILEVTDPTNNPEKDLSTIGYELKDINGDGVEELFISDSNNIFGLYTIKDDEAVLVTEGWARSRNYLLSDNTIYYEGSGGATCTIFGTYRLNSGSIKLEAIDMYFSDFIDDEQQEIGWFYNSEGSGSVNDSVLAEMTTDDILSLRDEYRARRVQLDLIYFISYTPSE